MTKLIYVIEDEPWWRDWIVRLLKESFPDFLVEPVAYEKEFVDRFDEIADKQPKCIVLDLMLQWTEASVDRSEAPGDFVNAGVRCYERLARDPRTKAAKIVIYTVLDRDDVRGLPPDVPFVGKDDPDSKLLSAIQGALDA